MTQCDFSDVRGQAKAVAHCERSATLNLNLMIVASPGIGSTMLARRMVTILPEITAAESMEVAERFADQRPHVLYEGRPLRAPHHSCSAKAILGEAELAQCGVLYLDELSEFRRAAIHQLGCKLAAMDNPPLVVCSVMPCPCGFYGSKVRKCECTDGAITRHRERYLELGLKLKVVRMTVRMTLEDLRDGEPAESSATIRARVTEARA